MSTTNENVAEIVNTLVYVEEEDIDDNIEDGKIIVNPYNFNNKLINKYELESILRNYGVEANITNLSYYHEAFSHKSYCKKEEFENNDEVEVAEQPEGCLELRNISSERLEFLGDSILGAVVAHYLHERYPDKDEGFMTRLKIKLVNGEALAEFSKAVGLSKYVLISRHVEERCGGRSSVKVLEDAFEAFIGALYIDYCDNYSFDWIINYIEALENKVKKLESQLKKYDNSIEEFTFKDLKRDIMKGFMYGPGYNVAQNFIINVIEDNIDFSELIINNTNFKDQLLRYYQHTFHITPKYQMISQEGQSHERIFRMSVLDKDGDVLAIGEGRTKKKAEQEASKLALIKFGLVNNY
tara:strand:+ start:2008 stop:3069 length:1062 start_codon:yes stop_codon:yes gene_type:complete